MHASVLNQLGIDPNRLSYFFNGLTFFAGQTPGAQVGASVTPLGDINGDGAADGRSRRRGIAGVRPGPGRTSTAWSIPRSPTT